MFLNVRRQLRCVSLYHKMLRLAFIGESLFTFLAHSIWDFRSLNTWLGYKSECTEYCKNKITLSSQAILSPISQIMRIWCSFENSKFYRVFMSSLSVLPPSQAASFSKHPKCYHFCVRNEGILFRNSFASSVVCLFCKLLSYN